ncbi:hypothetical protein RAM19_04210 [Bartonella apihabitans]|uniref:hypothetical protein n=1 Tax=uncultured Bartonella sp. TaxID=104108 RepID=UPI0025EDB083|nr:hypothetical protein [Bartonella apihabitans]WLT09375.1 hypothetical protein RAM19_04210 [Bartonella apihabitans]
MNGEVLEEFLAVTCFIVIEHLSHITDASPKRASNDCAILDIFIIAVSFSGFNNPKTASI